MSNDILATITARSPVRGERMRLKRAIAAATGPERERLIAEKEIFAAECAIKEEDASAASRLASAKEHEERRAETALEKLTNVKARVAEFFRRQAPAPAATTAEPAEPAEVAALRAQLAAATGETSRLQSELAATRTTEAQRAEQVRTQASMKALDIVAACGVKPSHRPGAGATDPKSHLRGADRLASTIKIQ